MDRATLNRDLRYIFDHFFDDDWCRVMKTRVGFYSCDSKRTQWAIVKYSDQPDTRYPRQYKIVFKHNVHSDHVQVYKNRYQQEKAFEKWTEAAQTNAEQAWLDFRGQE